MVNHRTIELIFQQKREQENSMGQFPPIDLAAIAEAIDPEAMAPREPAPPSLTLRIADGIVTVTLFALFGFLCALFAGV